LADEWGEALPGAREATSAICAAVGKHQQVRLLLLPDAAAPQSATTAAGTHLLRIPYGDVWLRDTGPVFVHADGRRKAVCFGFNGWGNKYLFPHDESVGPALADNAQAERDTVPELILEGGALESDGAGTLITTRTCVLNRNRNPHKTENDVNALLRRHLGAQTIIWLEEGLLNDHTDGHVDNLARFVATGHVVCAEPAPTDPNRDQLLAVLKALEGTLDANGNAIQVTRIPSPGALTSSEGTLLPATHLNFLITNQCVVLPVYGTPSDDRAAEVLAGLFPQRAIVPIRANAVLAGGGAFHCISRELPVCP